MRQLTGKFARIVYETDAAWHDYYPDKFRARRAVMLCAVNLGWSLENCQLVFTNPLNPGSRLWTHGRDERLLTEGQTAKRLMGDYEAATRRALARPPYRDAVEARQALGVALAAVRSTVWRGRAGRTDRGEASWVSTYVLRRATEVGCDRVHVSARNAAIGSGVTPQTAARSLNRLVKSGWLGRRKAEVFDQANVLQGVS